MEVRNNARVKCGNVERLWRFCEAGSELPVAICDILGGILDPLLDIRCAIFKKIRIMFVETSRKFGVLVLSVLVIFGSLVYG